MKMNGAFGMRVSRQMLSSLNNILRASVRLVGLLCRTLRADFVAFSTKKIIDVTYPVAHRIHCAANCIVFFFNSLHSQSKYQYGLF